MRALLINGESYKYDCVYVTKRSISGNIGIVAQLQVFKNEVQIDNKNFNGYVQEKIEEDIKNLINQKL